ncbi:MAG: class I SAM-dependent RNA methyltransferase [Gemmatimonadaceae bacterium]
MTNRFEVAVESIAAGGDGVARANGLVVFVPRSAPGDVGIVDVAPRGSFARSEFAELLASSPQRVTPPCPHYTMDKCGGCQLQHIEYSSQLAAKSRIVTDAFRRIGARIVSEPEVSPSADQWRYRRKLTLALRRRGQWWTAGLHPYDDPGRIFPVDDCPITHESVISVWREVLSASSDFPYARELRGSVRLSLNTASFTLEGGNRWPNSGVFFDRVPSLTTLWWQKSRRERRLLHERPDGGVRAPGASFTQVNAGVAADLQARVVDLTLQHEPRTVVDAYSGLGDLAVGIAERQPAVEVCAIEMDVDAAAWTTRRLRVGSRCLVGRVENLLPQALPADVIILNPPRAGVDSRVTDTLVQTSPAPRAIIYVSCDPATLARDVRRLDRFRIASLQLFDMFPQTAHVETVCELVPGAP